MRALRALVFVCLALVLALPIPFAAAQRDANVVITAENNGETVQMRVGDLLQVELPQSSNSEFLWLLLPTETFAQAEVVLGDVWAVGPAVMAGFEVGDKFLSINGEPVESTLDLDNALEELAGETVPVVVLRGEEEVTLDLTIEEFEDPGIERPMLTGFLEGMPAAEAGFEIGDVLLAVDGEDITNITQLQEFIGAREGAEVVVTVRRGAEKLEIPVTPDVDPTDGAVRIGISIVALDYAFAGLGVANLNVESYIGVRPFNSPIPLPQGVERRFMLAQIGNPMDVTPDDAAADDPGLSVWQFEAIGVGQTRLTLLNVDPTQAPEDIAPDQFFEVLVDIRPAPGPAA